MQTIFKSASQSADDPMTFVLSDGTTDRMGDVLNPAGWELTNFRQNPIALWAHASSRPIGVWSDVVVRGKQLIGKLNFAAKGTSSLIDELRSLVEQRILKTVSVGFSPLEAEPIRDPKGNMTGWFFKSMELLEVSLVSVPANPSAISVARSLNISEAVELLAFSVQPDERQMTFRTSPGASAVKAREALAKAQAALGVKRK